MNITVSFWEAEGGEERATTFRGEPNLFPYWLQGLLSTGAFVTRVTI